ncbi:polysulfide reductase NrfD [Thiohalobacter sp. IOR34]|uniref:NrfD/PsrC family molybdoenzyme membrane anchor subunit n=1 Tax=Thiohalobacter sp. IOR34 TaxID=3057176 RepID=UPI0025B15D79|nr:NrfD/PsrC family molybdoenzyme membrane anchor subunit [Thiohalobacter sp. IOR34]WJW74352.1 polysulfide reductase NrfD [Thiohalobacter sp. IOR34]
MKQKIHFREVTNNGIGYYGLLGLLGLIIALGLGAAYYMEHNGHWVTGMNNQVVWGTPHVFAVFLIVAASGALNIASIGSVFGKVPYKPLGRLSGLLAIALLVGGLAVLVLDLGRPDRLIVAMTHYNFKSIFAWNIFLYTGFMAIVAVYLWMMMDPTKTAYSKPAGLAAFLWRLALTTGTGSIFGFLVARQAYDAAIYAPMFIVMSFSFGLAIYLLVLMAAMKWTGRELGDVILYRMKNLLGVFIAGVLFFVVVYHLTNLYATEHHGWERFILLDGGVYTKLFWIGQVLLGSLVPLAMVYHPTLGKSRSAIAWACGLVILGGIAQIYTIIIGGQAYPLVLFPGMEVSSSFSDGIVNAYSPSLPEVVLGIGGIAIALAAVVVGVKVLRFLPETLEDRVVDPHHAGEKAH